MQSAAAAALWGVNYPVSKWVLQAIYFSRTYRASTATEDAAARTAASSSGAKRRARPQLLERWRGVGQRVHVVPRRFSSAARRMPSEAVTKSA